MLSSALTVCDTHVAADCVEMLEMKIYFHTEEFTLNPGSGFIFQPHCVICIELIASFPSII